MNKPLPPAQGGSDSGAGLIGVFARHPTAANLLMIILIVLGLFATLKLNTQFFPTLEIPAITVSVEWSGASAEDVEANILDALEPELRFLDDIDQVTAVAREGMGVITIEFYADADMQKALSDVEQAVAGVTTLPQDAEEPKISRITFYEPVAKLAVSGPFSEKVLKDYAKQLRDGLLDAGIDRVTFTGARDEEIWVTVPEANLRRLKLGLDDIARRVRANTSDLPSGTVKGSSEVQLRSLSAKRTPEQIGKIEVKSTARGDRTLLSDIARIETRFDDDAMIGLHNGKRSIELSVQRAVSADTLKTMKILNTYLARTLPTLPQSLKIEKYDVRGELVAGRLGILIKNGIQGLILVLIVLFIFLNMRIAFWVAAGIPVAFLTTLAVMWLSGQSINMVSMFALIMMLGIIVDDAIVVGEETATRQARGDNLLIAAERGAIRMVIPVLAASLTTIAAFLPIFVISGRIGDVMTAIPLVVIAVLVASLIECFLILPGHLSHTLGGRTRQPGAFRRRFDNGLAWFRDGPFRRFVQMSYEWRYTTVAVTIAALILCIGLIAGGRIGFHFFPSPESENISAQIEFGAGTPEADQIKAIARIDAALRQAEAKLSSGKGGLVVTSFATLGKSGRNAGDSLAQIDVQLTPSERRRISTKRVIGAWRKHLPRIPGIENITLLSRRAGPPGRDLDVQLMDAPALALKKAAEELKAALTGYPGISAVSDDLPYGKREFVIEVNPRGAALGLTAENVGSQLRNAFQGAIATRFARGDEEITVRVRREQDVPGVQALKSLYLRTPSGDFVPLPEVVHVREKTGFAFIRRKNGRRTVAVTADIDPEISSVRKAVSALSADILPRLASKYHLKYSFAGRAEDQAKSFADLKLGALLALILIYVILAWVFENYAKPLAVMAIIPFGLVGAIVGHMIMGVPLTIISLIGLLGLSGILVNDSIILVSQVKERLRQGDNLEAASIGASQDRLRAVLLTSLTTIGGLFPLLFETSRQAQFLIPMAITLVFGLAASTLLVLVLVPSLMGVGSDIGKLARALKRLYVTPPSAGHARNAGQVPGAGAPPSSAPLGQKDG